MKYFIYLSILFSFISASAQIDSLKLGERYWEDQLYIGITYNTLNKQLDGISSSGFSYGFSTGYIKDIPFNRRGNWAGAIGVGYSFDSFTHGLKVDNSTFSVDDNLYSNKIKLHNVEFPIQIRWRASDAVTYSFWRIYAGVRLSYNFSNRFKYVLNEKQYSFSNITNYNKFQTGLELSFGYSAFNFYVYYGLTPMYKNAYINNEKIDTRIAKFGLIFYLL